MRNLMRNGSNDLVWFDTLPPGLGPLLKHTLQHRSSSTSAGIVHQLMLLLLMGFVVAWFEKAAQTCPPHHHGAHQDIMPQPCLGYVHSFLCLPLSPRPYTDSS